MGTSPRLCRTPVRSASTPDMHLSGDYADAFDEVFSAGRDNIIQRNAAHREQAAIGIFWGGFTKSEPHVLER
jgi:hypothetical protein